MSGQRIHFRKMNGLGNDFVVVDNRGSNIALTKDQISRLADRETGIGFDQFIAIESAPAGADVFMRIHNADGGEVSACGNATRCIGWLLMEETGLSRQVIATNAGRLIATPGPRPYTVTVDMGEPLFDWQDIPLAEEFADTSAIELQIGPIDDPILHTPSVANVGNPHAIFWIDGDVNDYDLATIGPMLEYHPLFPERANISIAHVRDRNSAVMRVWERGVGLTRACGTAACAAIACGVRRGLLDRIARIELPGGPLDMQWDGASNHILMTGPIALDHEGTIDLATLAWNAEALGTA